MVAFDTLMHIYKGMSVKGCLTKGFYTLEKYRHSLEKSGYADFFCSWGSSTAPMKFQ